MATQGPAAQQGGRVQAALAGGVLGEAGSQQLAQLAQVGVADPGAVGVVQFEVGTLAQQLAAMGEEGRDADAGGHQQVLARLAVQREQVGRCRQAQDVAGLELLVQVA
ncbi:hypothetical protein FQZ97_1263030 [compost metagenome]